MTTTEYSEEVFRRTQEGGTLWFIERMDTNQVAFVSTPFSNMYSNSPDFGLQQLTWGSAKTWTFGFLGFLTEEDAQRYINNPDPGVRFSEGGCHCCGNGSTPIEVKPTKHLYISPKLPE